MVDATRSEMIVDKTPVSATVVTQKEIESRPLKTIDQLLTLTEGVARQTIVKGLQFRARYTYTNAVITKNAVVPKTEGKRVTFIPLGLQSEFPISSVCNSREPPQPAVLFVLPFPWPNRVFRHSDSAVTTEMRQVL